MADCHVELDWFPIVETTIIDVERLAQYIAVESGGEFYWQGVPQIDTACKAPAILPGQFDRLSSMPNAGQMAKPVSRVRLEGLSGVVFVYISQGAEEVATGLAAALVEYRPDGTPWRVYKASELLRDEGWGRLTTSTLTATSIERCDQELEYFAYSPEGDIVEELEAPIRTPRFCELIVLLPTR
ncbi:hypothetical protein [Lysobacter sp. F6437]|uniref:hypothetical protein n=1 Tax=Lysobacter sp. F6437 TaxID=3459296 RepID=UPI00403DB4E9